MYYAHRIDDLELVPMTGFH